MPETRRGSSSVPKTAEHLESSAPLLSVTEQNATWKEDAEHIVENLWWTEEEDALHKMFMKQATRGTQQFLRHSKE